MENRPKGREVHNVGGTGNVNKRGSGLGTGPVGTTGGHSSRPSGTRPSMQGGPMPQRPVRSNTRGGGKLGLLVIIAIIAVLAGKMGLGGGSTPSGNGGYTTTTSGSSSSAASLSTIMSMLSSMDYTTTASDYSAYTGSASTSSANLDTTVAKGSRAKRTEILGNGRDTITFMLYMCGTDLESKSGMGSSDLKEICAASLSDNINFIVYTGGCNEWKTSGISNRVNQIYKVSGGRLECLESDMGSKAMTDPATLTEFIKYCTKNYPANRQNLIFWDHGSGSISGYGYDEKFKTNGSMNLSGINKALNDAGAKFDFIGFDACLMATVENGLMLSKYADYMIASEETEPGVGWYYTNWLTKLSNNTSMDTIEIGKNIVDDFVDVCNAKCNGQKTTLSVVDLAELENTVPGDLKAFATSTKALIDNNEYKQVSDARNNTKEFAQSSKIDQIDLVHFAKNLKTEEGEALAKALMGAVKYNRTASCVKDAYGLSIYFPYKKASKVDQVAKTYKAIGMDDEYSDCIKSFAALEVGGQATTGGTTSAMPSLLGEYSSSNMGSDSLGGILGSLLTGGSFQIGGIDSSSFSFLMESGLTADRAGAYISENYLDTRNLVWVDNNEGRKVLALTEKDWSMIENIDLNVFYDDGEGYIDLGMDNILNYDSQGNLYGEYDGSWLSINGQVVPYYHTETTENGNEYLISGYIPAFLNGDRAEIIMEFSNEFPYGIIRGARYVYDDDNAAIAKDMLGLRKGDKLDFICDYYTYEGQYVDSYYLGETMTVGDTMEIGNISIDKSKTKATYCITDLYQQRYWSDIISN
ncbi:MAG: clostripain-related cysteine peptidase [Lachnospiraceae bacterium]|nr:clostripain-related cysteine peptidase [Lachnospiraceae bacterium]